MLPGKRYKLEDVLDAARRRMWIIAIPWLVVTGGTIAVVSRLPDHFRSVSVIQVVPPRVPESYVRANVTRTLEARLPVITQQILSRTRLERVIQDFGLYSDERKTKLMEDIVERMRNDVNVLIVKGDAFQVSYESNDPKTAMKVTERLAALFIEENLRDREGLAEGANAFLESQLDEARRRLLEHEKKLEEYRRDHNGELPSQTQGTLQTIQNNQTQLQGLTDSIIRDRDRRLMLERMLADASVDQTPPAPVSLRPDAATGEVDTAGGSAATQLEAARNSLHAMELRLKPTHPDILRMKRAIAELERKAEAEAARAPLSPGAEPRAASPAEVMRQNKVREIREEMENIDRQVARREETQRRLQENITELQRRVNTAPTRETELVALTRDYDTLRNIYTSILAKNEDAKLAANVERRQIGEQFKVIDPARLPEQPYSPDRFRLNAIGVAIGLGLGVGFVIFLEYRDTSFRTDDDVVALLTLPVLATVPLMVTTLQQRVRRRRLIVACATVVLVATGGAAALGMKFHVLTRVVQWWR